MSKTRQRQRLCAAIVVVKGLPHAALNYIRLDELAASKIIVYVTSC
jgi:hypothetical protein